jgi:hypothetical protein
MPEPTETWGIAQVAEFLRIQKGSARGLLSRWGVKAVRYEPGESGRPEARYDAEQVRDEARRRPGRGARTDLTATKERATP